MTTDTDPDTDPDAETGAGAEAAIDGVAVETVFDDWADRTVADIRELVRHVETYPVLERMQEMEAAGADRKTAHDAIESRMDVVDGDPIGGGEATALAAAEAEGAAESDAARDLPATELSYASTTPTEGHRAVPAPAGGRETIVVRNPDKTTKHLRGLKGSLAPGETREYPVSDRVKHYIRDGELQVVTTRR